MRYSSLSSGNATILWPPHHHVKAPPSNQIVLTPNNLLYIHDASPLTESGDLDGRIGAWTL